MSENNVENTSYKIDDVAEEKSQFEIDNERRAQLEKEQAQESVKQSNDVQEIQDEEQSQGQEEVQEEEVVQEEHAPIQISHKTQIVDNFFDGPPPVKAKAPEKQNENTQTNAQAEKTQQQDNNENVVETKNAAVNQNIQQEAGIPQNQEVKNEVKSETSEPLPPIKLPKHNSVIVDNNLDMPRKKVAPANTKENKANASENVQNKTDNNVKSDTQNVAEEENTAKSVDSQQNTSNVEASQEPTNTVAPPPIKLPKHNSVIVDNNLDMPRKKVTPANAEGNKANTSENAQNKTDNVVQSQRQNTAEQKNTASPVSSQQSTSNTQGSQKSTNEVNVEAKAEEVKPEAAQPLPPIKLPKHNSVIVDNNLDMPRKKVAPANAEGNKANTSENAQNKTDNAVQSQTQNTAEQKNTVSPVSSQQSTSNTQSSQMPTNEVKVEAEAEVKHEAAQPLPPIKLPKHNSVIVDNNLDMPRKKTTPANTDTKTANTNQNAQSSAEDKVQVQAQNTSTAQNVQKSEVPNKDNNQNSKDINQGMKAEVKTEPAYPLPPIKLPKHETEIVDNNLDMLKKKSLAEKTDAKVENTSKNQQDTADNLNVKVQTQNVANTDQNVQVQTQKQVQNVQEQSQKQAQDTATVQNTQNNVQQSKFNAQSQHDEVQAPPPPIKLPKHETVIVDNNLDIESGKKNKKNKKADKNAEKNTANNNVVKEAEVKTVQQTSSKDNKLSKDVKTTEAKVSETEKIVQNKAVETKDAKTEIKQKEDNAQNKAKSQDVNAKIAVENKTTQVEKAKLEELEKKVPTFNDRDDSNHLRRSQIISQSTSDIMTLISSDMYAGFWIRCVAFIVDAVFVICLLNIAVYFDIESYIPMSIGIVYMVLFAFYSFVFVYLFDGQSIGKMLTGIKVVEDKGNKLAFSTVFVREFAGKIIMIPLFLTFIFTAFSYKKRSLMDYLSGTSVIKSKYHSLYDELMADTEEH